MRNNSKKAGVNDETTETGIHTAAGKRDEQNPSTEGNIGELGLVTL